MDSVSFVVLFVKSAHGQDEGSVPSSSDSDKKCAKVSKRYVLDSNAQLLDKGLLYRMKVYMQATVEQQIKKDKCRLCRM